MSDQFIRCKVCDEKVTEGEQASIVHDKCMVSHKDHEEIKEEKDGLWNELHGHQDYVEGLEHQNEGLKEVLERLKKAVKRSGAVTKKELKFIISKMEDSVND